MDKENVVYIYTMEYDSAIKKEILQFLTAWMDLEDIRLSEVRKTEDDKCHVISLYVKSE